MAAQVKTIAITLGRNVDDTPMDQHDWDRFQLYTARTLQRLDANIILRPATGRQKTGFGVWDGNISEEAAAFVAIVPVQHVPALRRSLAEIALKHGQEAIGFIEADGDDNLVLSAIELAEPA